MLDLAGYSETVNEVRVPLSEAERFIGVNILTDELRILDADDDVRWHIARVLQQSLLYFQDNK